MKVSFEYKHYGKLVNINNMYYIKKWHNYVNGELVIYAKRGLTTEAAKFKNDMALIAWQYFNHISEEVINKSHVRFDLIITGRYDRFDIDLRKPVYDALQGVAYRNDKQIRQDSGRLLINKNLDCNYLYQITISYLSQENKLFADI